MISRTKAAVAIGSVAAALLAPAADAATPAVSAAEPNSAKFDADAVSAAVSTYATALAGVLAPTDQTATGDATSAATQTGRVASQALSRFMAATTAAGEVITQAQVDPTITSSSADESGVVTSTVVMKVTMRLENDGSGNPTTSGFTEQYRITLTPTRGGYAVTGQQDIAADEAASPDDPAPAFPSSADNAADPPLR